MKSILTTLLLLAAPFALADTHDEIVARAFASMEQDLSANWAFTETARSSDGTYAAHCDPRRDRRWELISVDGRDP